MNERIRELVEQCTEVDSVGIDETFYYRYDLEKFAELIVRECALVGLETHGNYDVHDDILKHFGVEE